MEGLVLKKNTGSQIWQNFSFEEGKENALNSKLKIITSIGIFRQDKIVILHLDYRPSLQYIGQPNHIPTVTHKMWIVSKKITQALIQFKRNPIKRVLLCCCGSGRVALDAVQSSSESLVRQTLPWTRMSSQDQYGITAPQIQTLTLHHIAPPPLQARKRRIKSIYYPLVLVY